MEVMFIIFIFDDRVSDFGGRCDLFLNFAEAKYKLLYEPAAGFCGVVSVSCPIHNI